jgi:hypothetical protein
VTFSYLDPRPWARHALLRSGFVPSARGINVLTGARSGPDPAVTQDLDAWYLTLGDTERV